MVGDWWRARLASTSIRLRTGGRGALLWSARVTIAATASYVVALLLFPGTEPLLAPLTAMLVVQVTPVSLLASGLDRVLSVVAGVSLAVGFAAVVPLRWWSLGLLILVSITIGQAMRLRANLVEVAISAMLVLGVGSLGAGAAAWQRVTETLVGAAVGVVANLLFPPKVTSGDAGAAIDGLAGRVSALLTRVADELTHLVDEARPVAPAARAWLGEARHITHDIPQVGAALLRAEQSRRLNVRAVGSPDLGPGLRQGLEALEHSAVSVRGLLRAVLDATTDPRWPGETARDSDGVDADPTAADATAGEAALRDLAETLRAMASGLDAFGQLVRDEAAPGGRLESHDVAAVRSALDGLVTARTRLQERVDTRAGRPVLVELDAATLAAVKRLVHELDLGERARRQVRLRPARGRRRPTDPASRPAHAEPTPDDETQVLPPVRPRERE